MKSMFNRYLLEIFNQRFRLLKSEKEIQRLFRYTRVMKYRKKGRYKSIVFQLLSILYFLIFTVSYLSTSTGANFTDRESVEASIQVGEWPIEWDKSSLEFLKQQKMYGVNCSKNIIFANVQNGKNSEPMQGSVIYEVYWKGLAEGSPQSGIKVDSGIISNLDNGESIELTYEPSRNPNGELGKYMFKAYQRTGHPGTGELWSEQVEHQGCQSTIMNTESTQNGLQDASSENLKEATDEAEASGQQVDPPEKESEAPVNTDGEIVDDQKEPGEPIANDSEPNVNGQEEVEVKSNSTVETKNTDLQSEKSDDEKVNVQTTDNPGN